MSILTRFFRALAACCLVSWACLVSAAPTELRLGVYDFDDGARPAWLCEHVATTLRAALAKRLAGPVELHWVSASEYEQGARAFNDERIDIAYFENLGPVWVARATVNARLLDAFRDAVKEVDEALRASASACPGNVERGADRERQPEYLYVDGLPAAHVIRAWLARLAVTRFNALPPTAAGELKESLSPPQGR